MKSGPGEGIIGVKLLLLMLITVVGTAWSMFVLDCLLGWNCIGIETLSSTVLYSIASLKGTKGRKCTLL